MKVLVTGMGAISSLGNAVGEMWSGLDEGRSAVRHYPQWGELKGLHACKGAPAPPHDASSLPRQARRTMSRMSELATLATIQALRQADLHIQEGGRYSRILLCMGSTTGSPETLETYFRRFFERGGPEGQFSTSFFKVMNHSVAANVAQALGFNGALMAPASACATSAQAMILGWELIRAGAYDIVIAGGADELHPISSAVFDIVMAASRGFNDDPERSPRPFDLARDGLVVSEGAGVVVLESDKSASRRGVRGLAELLGGAYLCESSHMSQSNAGAMAEVMRLAVERAGRTVSEIGYVNAHATGTGQGDREEARALREVVGEGVPVSSLKGHLGHSLAACGALEAIASITMMEKGVLIPTRNLETVDPECDGVDHLREKRAAHPGLVLSNNFAFGGMNTSLLLSLP